MGGRTWVPAVDEGGNSQRLKSHLFHFLGVLILLGFGSIAKLIVY